MDNLIIEGFIGSGKGAVAKSVAKKLKLSVVDLDKMVSQRMKMTSAEIYDRFGEPYYRAMETLILDELTSLEKRTVIVLGSGAATMPQNRQYFKKLGKVYYLCLKPEELLENMKKSNKKHEWIRGESWDEQVIRIFREREPYYKETADVTIDAGGKTADEVAGMIISASKEK